MTKYEHELIEKFNILNRLNEIALMDFKASYDKTELERLFDRQNNKSYNLALELENEINNYYAGSDLKVKVSHFGTIRISNSNVKDCIIRSEIFDLLPYAFVMGKKISKKNFKNSIEIINMKYVKED